MKKIIISLTVVFAVIAICTVNNIHGTLKQTAPADYEEFEQVRDSLYDCALTICLTLSKDDCDDGVFYRCVDKHTQKAILNYQVPNLKFLLKALDEIDSDGCLVDVWDDCSKYDYFRAKYENYFIK